VLYAVKSGIGGLVACVVHTPVGTKDVLNSPPIKKRVAFYGVVVCLLFTHNSATRAIKEMTSQKFENEQNAKSFRSFFSDGTSGEVQK
jgi:hypothetical protein